MRDDVRRSLKLNRDISKLLEQAVKVDRAIKIGWNREGDEIPKVGEMGICPALPKGGRVRLLGELGDAVAIMGTGGAFTLVGSAGDWFGAWNQGTSIAVERSVGNNLGHAMNSGRLIARDGAGDDVGSQMSGGLLVVRGDVGIRVGGGMSGGTIVIHGDVGSEPGVGMKGGRIIINGRCPSPGEGVEFTTLKPEELSALNKEIEDSSLEIPSDAVCLLYKGGQNTKGGQNYSSDESLLCESDWSGIGIVPSDLNTSHLQSHATIDTMVLIGERTGDDSAIESEPVGLHLPLLPKIASAKGLKSKQLSAQPFLVQSNPRSIDLMLVDSTNISTCSKDLSDAGGVVLNISNFPPLSAPSLDAILVALRNLIGEGAPFLLMASISTIERLHLSSAGSQVDGAIATLCDASRTPAAAGLPKSGRSAASAKLADRGISLGFSIGWDCSGADLIISRCSGAEFLVATPPEDMQTPAKLADWLSGLQNEMNDHLVRIGTDSIEKLARKNLRALDTETASISGLRLTGYERPMPHWFAS